MRTAAVHITKSVVPERYWIHLQSLRSRRRQMQWLQRHGILDLGKRFLQSNGSKVLYGPFQGMKYPTASILSRHSVPRLLGSYESELHPVIYDALQRKYTCIVDIGTAEGYYAVGFALKGASPVVTYEADPRELRLCKAMARENNVEARITAKTFCTPKELRALGSNGRCFVLSDCEGYETELFDESTVEALRRSDLLIELHGNAYEPLFARLSETHDIQTFVAQDKSSRNYPELSSLGDSADLAICEFRDAGQRWLFAQSRESERSRS